MPMPVAGFPDAAMIACLFFIFLVPLAAAGISLINAGLGRSRNAGHMMMAVICTLSIAAFSPAKVGIGLQRSHFFFADWRSMALPRPRPRCCKFFA